MSHPPPWVLVLSAFIEAGIYLGLLWYAVKHSHDGHPHVDRPRRYKADRTCEMRSAVEPDHQRWHEYFGTPCRDEAD